MALWTDKTIWFSTPMGSRLYGLAHEDSDYDTFVIVDKVKHNRAKYAKQTIEGQNDTTVLDFGTWLNLCRDGNPQPLEAMFSQHATVDRIAEFRAGYIYKGNYDKYLGVMKSMSIQHADSYKHKRHILRLGLNMKSLRSHGRFNPTLSRMEIELINSLAKLPMEHVYNDALAIAWK